MNTKRGDDAQDHARRPKDRDRDTSGANTSDEKHDQRADERAIEVEDINSANDEGAN